MPAQIQFLNQNLQNLKKPLQKKILIVEDEADLREILYDKLTYAGFDVFEAENGEEGYKKALSCKPDLILLDIIMPVTNGLAMMKKLSDDYLKTNIPIIIMTNVGELETVIDMFDHNNFNLKENTQTANYKQNEFNIKIYLETRTGNNLRDYVIKTNNKLDVIVEKIQKALS